MSFAETYLSRYASEQVIPLPGPDKNLCISIIIPVYNEPGLLKCLDSLIRADPPGISWEMIIVINEPAGCPQEYHLQNLDTIKEVDYLKNVLDRSDLEIHLIFPEPFVKKKAGPGMARKIGMDEAIRRYNTLKKPEGLLVSFDADTVCSKDYLLNLKTFFLNNSDAEGCTVYFEHPLEGDQFADGIHKNPIVQYELYLRYFKMALDWAGFPYSCYALGSAFAVRASRYVAAGGMGLQQAGEDFYFLQKCLPLGAFWELNSTTVYPSSRISDRVVFGTGPVVSRLIREKEVELEVYPLELFVKLKPLFSWINNLEEFPVSTEEAINIMKSFPKNIRDRLIKRAWKEKILKAFDESATLGPFKKRFYHEINLLQTIHLLNELTIEDYPKLPVKDEFVKLLLECGFAVESEESEELLHRSREIERSKGNVQIC